MAIGSIQWFPKEPLINYGGIDKNIKILDNAIMNKLKPKMIVMDLDGTLLSEDKNISEYTLSILEKCKQNNILIGIATARSEKSSKRFTDLINPDIMILNGGALVINKNNEIIFDRFLSEKTSDGIIKECIKNHNTDKLSVHTEEKVFVNYEHQYKEYVDFTKPFKHKVFKITLHTKDKNSLVLIEKEFPECELMNFSDEDYYVFAHKNAKKFDAINALSNKIKIHISEIISFGDDYNDIEMVKNCGIGIAMENGIDEIKNAAKYVCGNNNEDGVGKWIEENIWLY